MHRIIGAEDKRVEDELPCCSSPADVGIVISPHSHIRKH